MDIVRKKAYEILWGVQYFHSFCFVLICFGFFRGIGGGGGVTTLKNLRLGKKKYNSSKGYLSQC